MTEREWSSRRAYALVLSGAGSYTCLMFIWFSLPAYLPTVIDDLGLSGTEAGLLAGAVPLTYIPLALFSGLAVDRIGPARSLAVGMVLFGLAQLGRSVATGFSSLLVATLLLGVGATAITFGLPKLVSVLFPPDETGLPSSLYLVAASAGTAGAFALGRPVVGPALGGWRPLFGWSGAVAVAYAAVWYGLARAGGLTGAWHRDTATTGFTHDALAADLRAVLGHRELRLVVAVGVSYLLVIHGLQGWLPTVLETRGLSAARAGGATTLLVAANVAGILTVPGLADRYDARRTAVIASGAVAFVGGLGILLSGTRHILIGGIVFAGVGVGGLSPLVRAIPPDLDGVGAALTGTAVGFVFAVGEVGGFLGPTIVGVLHDVTGSYAPGLMVLASGGLVAVLAGFAMREV